MLLLLSRLSRVQLYATPWTAVHQTPPVPGILQARTLEWVAISWTAAHQAPPSMGFSRQEHMQGVVNIGLELRQLGS